MNGTEIVSPLPGKALLKVSGILMIIFSTLTLAAAVFAVKGVMDASKITDEAANEIAVNGITLLMFTFAPFILVEFISGIFGVKYCGKPKNARTCIVWGIVLAVIISIELILHFATELEIMPIVFSGIIGLILLSLYLFGATQNKKSVRHES